MAGGQLWGVWAQTITNDTTAANVEKYGEIEDMAEAYRDGFAKDFCDGQTSPTPPRWPDDGMQLLYFYDRESAELVSQFLRGDVVERMQGQELFPQITPTWARAPLAFPTLRSNGENRFTASGTEDDIRFVGGTQGLIGAADISQEAAIHEANINNARALINSEAGQTILRSSQAFRFANIAHMAANTERPAEIQILLVNSRAEVGAGSASIDDPLFRVFAAPLTSREDYRNARLGDFGLDPLATAAHEYMHTTGWTHGASIVDALEGERVSQTIAAVTHLDANLAYDNSGLARDFVERAWMDRDRSDESRAIWAYLVDTKAEALRSLMPYADI